MWLAIVFALKLAVVFQLKDHILTQADAGLDTTTYVALAQRVRSGDFMLGPGLYFVSPLYIYFLAAALAVGRSFTFVRVLQALLGTAAVGLVFATTREWFGARAAWVAAALAALTGVVTFYESLLLQSAIDPFLTAAALCALTFGLTRNSQPMLAAAGLVFGLQSLNRPNIAIAAAGIILLAILMRRWRVATLLAAGFAIALLPVTLRNAEVANRWTPLSSHGGLNFYIGNNEAADGTYHAVEGVTPNLAGQQNDVRRVASAALGRDVDDAEASSYFYRLGLRWIRTHPIDAMKLMLKKASLLFSSSYAWLNYSYPFFREDAGWPLQILFVGPWLLVPLGLAGIVTRGSDPVFKAFVPFYALSIVIFFVADRYLLPLFVALAIGAGAAVDAMISAILQRRWRAVAVPASVMAILLLVTNRPVAADNGVEEERTRMAERLVSLGRYSEAEQWAARAADSASKPGLVLFRFGQRLLAAGQTSAAITHFEQALRFDPAQPEVEYILGEALLDVQRPAEAIPHLRRAFESGFHRESTGVDLVRALGAVGDVSGATSVLQVMPPADQTAVSALTLGDLAMQLRQPDLAVKFFSIAAERGEPVRGHFGLAAAAAASGRRADARREVEETLRLDPAYEPAQRLRAAIQ